MRFDNMAVPYIVAAIPYIIMTHNRCVSGLPVKLRLIFVPTHTNCVPRFGISQLNTRDEVWALTRDCDWCPNLDTRRRVHDRPYLHDAVSGETAEAGMLQHRLFVRRDVDAIHFIVGHEGLDPMVGCIQAIQCFARFAGQ